MKRWVTGALIGAGVGIVCGGAILLLGGEKPRHFLQVRYQQVRGALPEREQVQQYARQATTRLSRFAGSAKSTAQQAVQKVSRAGSEAGGKVEQLAPAGSAGQD